MILVYPMLTSSTVSPNIIPGACKILERFILVYRANDIVKDLNNQGNINLDITPLATGTGFRMKEDVDLSEQDPTDIGSGGGTPAGGGGKKGKDTKPPKLQQPRPSNAQVHIGNFDSLALEPTWIQVSGGAAGSRFLGIKVIPYPVKSDMGLASLMLDDMQMKGIEYKIEALKRKSMRLLWGTVRGFRLPVISKGTISGDPKKDILYASTKHRKNIFVMTNFAEVSEELFRNAGGVNKLFKLGWSSFCAADDVNRRLFCCMKEFKGMCSTVLYPFVYSAMKDQYKVFDSLDDARKSSSPFFGRQRGKLTKFVGEAKASQKLEDYLYSLRS